MVDTVISSSFVSEVVPVGFADAVAAAESLAGHTIGNGSARLAIEGYIGEGFAGAAWFSGRLRTGSPLLPSVKVDVVITPWSAGRVEVGIRPLGRIGRLQSHRAQRFFAAAWEVMPALVAALSQPTVAAPQPQPVAAAA